MSAYLSNDDVIETTYDDNNNNNINNNNDAESDNCDSGEKPYTYEQIAELLEYADIRTKVIILVMASAGLRLGALLRVRDLIEVSKHNVYQIRVYANSRVTDIILFALPNAKL